MRNNIRIFCQFEENIFFLSYPIIANSYFYKYVTNAQTPPLIQARAFVKPCNTFKTSQLPVRV